MAGLKKVRMSNKTTEISQRAKAVLAKSQKKNTLIGIGQDGIVDVLLPYVDSIQRGMPSGKNPQRIIQSAAFLIANDPGLKACTPASIIGCVMNTAILGLNPILDECYYVPFRTTKGTTEQTNATFIIGYKGLLNLARKTGQIKSIYAEVVEDGDVFEERRGTSPSILHIPKRKGNALVAVYAVAEYMNGGVEFVVLPAREVEKRRMASPAQGKGPSGVWAKWQPEMWKKTAIRVLSNTLPMSDEMKVALSTDETIVNPEAFQDGMVANTRDEEIAFTEVDDLSDDMPEIFADASSPEELERVFSTIPEKERQNFIESFNARSEQIRRELEQATMGNKKEA